MELRGKMMALTIGLLAAGGVSAATPAGSTMGAVNSHLEAAKKAAGVDFKGVLGALCLPNPPREAAAGGARGPRKTPARETWYAEPHQVFDNLYWVGTKNHSSWALKTSAGIIEIDTLFNYAANDEIVEGLKKLGQDPATIKYVIITHGHGDHDEGAKLLQDKFGAHVVMSAADWDMIEKGPDMPGGKPKRDIIGTDGGKITLGDTTVNLVLTPGHTAGTLSMIFPVKDRNRTVMVAYNGGTLTGAFGTDAARWDQYIASQKKMAAAAAKLGATAMITNHSEYDNAYEKAQLSQLRRSEDRSPFEVGTDGVARFFTVMAECAEAMKLEATSK
ncbi:MAG TPA: MBL fold metallo-hydrolase [Rhizomicrobium sp.]|nr:MBL fold metallo-hydrolase [Rhizomicrobium sp.]